MSIEETVREQTQIVPLVKAQLIGGDVGGSKQIATDDQDTPFTQAGAIEPEYDVEMLALLFDHSNSLRQNVDAYATNIDGFGHRIDPLVDLDQDGVDDRVQAELQRRNGNKSKVAEGTVAEFKTKLAAQIIEEREWLELFFDTCCHDESFVSLRKRTRQDKETLGNGYWEVLRSRDKKVSQFVYMPGFTMRLMPIDGAHVSVEEQVRVSMASFKARNLKKAFRRFVQIVDDRRRYFKEFGDPRFVSAKTGRAYATLDGLKEECEEGEEVHIATEVVHFPIHNPRGPYGVPRFIGNLLSVIGSRQSEEVNFLYFENKSVPPMVVLVSGGRLSDSSVQKVEDYIANNIKGKRNWHKILILEAEPAIGTASNETSARMKIELRPLISAQHGDALFQRYDEKNRDKVGESFRIPRLLRGDMRDFNRSTAFAALNFAEQQVFQPEREEFDYFMNRKILPALGVKYHKFVSLAPVTRDPVAMSEMVKNLTNANVLLPGESRELAGDVFNRVFKRIDALWTKQPIQFTLAGFDFTGQNANTAQTPEQGTPPTQKRSNPLAEFAKMLVGLRGEMRKASSQDEMSQYMDAHSAANDPDVEHIGVPVDVMKSWFKDEADGDAA